MDPEDTLTWLDRLIADTIPHVSVARSSEAAKWPELAPNPAPASTYILFAPLDVDTLLPPRSQLAVPLDLTLTVPPHHMAILLPLMPLLQKKKPLDVVLDYLPPGTTSDVTLRVRNDQDHGPLSIRPGEPLAQLLLVKLEANFVVLECKQ